MSKLEWQDFAGDKRLYSFAIADNGMQAIIVASDETFIFVTAFVNCGNLRKIAAEFFIGRELAEEWCENEIAQWIPNPDA